MKYLRILALAAAATLGSATWASAQEAFTTGDVNMRAGPGSRYPVVTTIPEDSNVYIHGCLSNWDWCDVSWRRNRGWVFSDYLEAYYRNRRIGFDEYRSFVDIPFVTFGFGYWDRYYRDRPWYGDWNHWGDHNDRWRDHNRDNDGTWDRNGSNDGTWRDRNGSNDGTWRDRNDSNDQTGDTRDDNNDRANNQAGDNNGRRMQCGTINADPDCPPNSRGRRLQMEQQQ